jgi:hypothetical protein
VLTHPSRFSLAQIQTLKECAPQGVEPSACRNWVSCRPAAEPGDRAGAGGGRAGFSARSRAPSGTASSQWSRRGGLPFAGLRFRRGNRGPYPGAGAVSATGSLGPPGCRLAGPRGVGLGPAGCGAGPRRVGGPGKRAPVWCWRGGIRRLQPGWPAANRSLDGRPGFAGRLERGCLGSTPRQLAYGGVRTNRWNAARVPVQTLLPSRNAVLQAAVRPPDQADYRYAVRYQVLGATGHRRFGGEDVTQSLAHLLEQRWGAGHRGASTARLGEAAFAPTGCGPPQSGAPAGGRPSASRCCWPPGRPTINSGSAFRGSAFGWRASRPASQGGSCGSAAVVPAWPNWRPPSRGPLEETLQLAQALLKAHGLKAPRGDLCRWAKARCCRPCSAGCAASFPGPSRVSLSDRAKTVVVEGGRSLFWPHCRHPAGSQVVVQRDSPHHLHRQPSGHSGGRTRPGVFSRIFAGRHTCARRGPGGGGWRI